MSDRMSDVDRLVYICGKILFMAEISAEGRFAVVLHG